MTERLESMTALIARAVTARIPVRAMPLLVCLWMSAPGARAAEPLLLLPLASHGLNTEWTRFANDMLRYQLQVSGVYTVLPQPAASPAAEPACADLECGVAAGRAAGAGKVVVGSLTMLGTKVVVQYLLADAVTGRALMTDQAIALTIEDLDLVIRRVAAALNVGQPVSRTAEVGTVTAQESQEVREREAAIPTGITFGLLYPVHGYGRREVEYDYRTHTWVHRTKAERSFAMDARTHYEMRNIAVTFLAGVRDGFALNVGAAWLPSLTDFSPFLGAGLGYHWVAAHVADDLYGMDSGDRKKADGPELILSSGFEAFRTYTFRVILSVDYSITFNDYQDQAVTFTIGVLRHKKNGRSGCLGVW